MKTPRSATLVLTSLLAAGPAGAATVSYQDSITVIESNELEGNNVIQLQKFNSSLGTLTGITLNVTLSLPSFTSAVDNDASAPANVTISFSTLGSPRLAVSENTIDTGLADFVNSADFAISVQATTFDVGLNDGDSTALFNEEPGDPDFGSYDTATILVGDTNHSIHSMLFGDYTVNGLDDAFTLEVAINFTTDMNLNSGGGGGDVRFQGVIPSATFTSEVIYSYSPVPESRMPGLGSLGVAFFLLRRRKH